MKINWHIPHHPNLAQPTREPRSPIHQANFVRSDLEIEEILDISTQASRVYGGIPTATRLPNAPPKADARKKPTRADGIADRSANWSTAVQNLLDQPPAAFPAQIMMGGVAFFAIFGAWAWFGTINEIAYARGELIHQGNVHKIHSVESGKIAHLAIEEGDTIKAGQVLAELDTELDRSHIEGLQQQIAAYEIQVVQTQGQIEAKQIERQTLEAISQADLEAHNAVIAQADNNANTIASSIDRLNQDIAEAENRRQRLTVEHVSVKEKIAPELLEQLHADIKANQNRLDRLKPLLEAGAISQDFLYQAERELSNSKNALLRTQMSDRDDRTVDSERLFEVEQSQRDWQSRLNESQGQLEQAKAEKDRLLAQFAQKQAEAEQHQLQIQEQIGQLEVELTQLQAKIAETRNLVTAAQTQLEQRFLYAPVDGVVLSLDINHSGEVVQTGQTIAQVAPQSAALVLRANLPTQEAGFIELGMPVQVKFDSYPYQEYGLISGKITSISPDTKPNEQLGKAYQVEISLEKNYVTQNTEKIYFKPGQTASAEMIIRHRRIIDIILDPIRQLKEGGVAF